VVAGDVAGPTLRRPLKVYRVLLPRFTPLYTCMLMSMSTRATSAVMCHVSDVYARISIQGRVNNLGPRHMMSFA
jgi:hypothetical protein